MYAYIVLLHVLGAFVFALAHGVSIAVALRLRGVRSREQAAALLDLSQMATGGLYVGLLLLLIGGVWAGFAGGHWGRLWIWVALGILIVVIFAMYAIATPYYGKMRVAAGASSNPAMQERYGDLGADDLAAMASSPRPVWLAIIGGIGLIAIVWLMVVKPF
jgi:hypothetical protein